MSRAANSNVRRQSLSRLLQVVHSQGLVVHGIEVTPDGYHLHTGPQGAVVSRDDGDDLKLARERLERARETRRAANGD